LCYVVKSIPETNTFGKCLQYFLYCNSEDLTPLSKNISKTISKLIPVRSGNISLEYTEIFTEHYVSQIVKYVHRNTLYFKSFRI